MTEPADDSSVAIIGMSGRFPGAADVDELWRNLREGTGGLREITGAELLAAGIDPASAAEPGYVRVGGPVAGLDLFDAAVFGFGAREAETLEPHHRLLLECSWEALERAGYCPTDPGAPVGLFAGSGFPDYLIDHVPGLGAEPGGKALLAAGIERDSLTSLVSYKLGLRGPSLTVQTFCSTSLVAVHLACQSLLTYECDLALAGGASLPLPQPAGYRYEEGGILSPDGRVRSLDAAANGTVMGSGVALVALKRLSEALADGDTVHAVILGSAVNNDGRERAGYGAPGVTGQSEVIGTALAVAGVEPESVGYVECHAVGTPLGDSIELAALARAFGGARETPCVLGSVKPSIGHLDRAAGVTGLLRAALNLRHRTLPGLPGFRTPNPALAAAGGTFTVLTEDRPWPAGPEPRRAGVSSFGVGGTNAHVVLQEAPPRPAGPARPGPHLLAFSAGDATALAALARRLREHLARHPDEDLADVAHTLQVSRGRFALRRAVVCRDHADALAALADPRRWIEGETRRRDPLVRLVADEAAPEHWWAELHRAVARLLAPAAPAPPAAPLAPGEEPASGPRSEQGDRAGALAALAAGLARIGVRPAEPGATGAVEVVVTPDGASSSAADWLLATIARLWQAGAVIDWPALHRGRGRRVELPGYPFQRRRYWIDAVAPAAGAPPVERTVLPRWRRRVLPLPGLDERLRPAGPWLVLAADERAEALAERLTHAGAEVAVVRPGPRFAIDELGDFAVRPAAPDDLAELLRSLITVPRTVVHGFSLAAPADTGGVRDLGRRSAAALARALAEAVEAAELPPVELVLLTAGAVGVLGPDLTHPEHAALGALAPSLALDPRHRDCRHLDLDAGTGIGAGAGLDADLDADLDATLDQVLAGAVAPHEGPLAVRGAGAWLRGHEPHPLPAPDPAAPALPADGTVLVTDGLDGEGLLIARHLAGAYGCNLVLTARADRRADPEAVRELERCGATVLVLSAAPDDEARLRAVVAAAIDAFGSLDVVVHTADVRTTADDAPADDAPAVRAFHALHRALGAHAPRRLALCPPEEPAAAALAAYAAVTRRWTTVDRTHAGTLAPAELGELVDGLLAAGPLGHLLVATGPFDARPAPEAAPAAATDRAAGGAAARRPRPALATPYVEPAAGVQRAVADALAAGLALDALGADDNFFDLGGRSATAVQLAARLAATFGVVLPVTALVEHPTVRLLSSRIAELTGPEGA
ncbi:SDR family NAD(P)-dependent oxidoreductase [Kitasatospora sp. NBC_01287]|uniref:SDR family NAD(P)-dependent oxidoreductase n=1 Tax=Kitasatospora sp. NBC_01287 TaxID=2903573 RepID=UPI00224E6AFC|nr:SDR family NAD(P)-dependent oxidoreductase [Kitasatospora sp. NBC_01287]MCX4750474.1 SDR family NAD(P)-dependent oxidoreductase [Kitasatospora sp. NBC_01287]